MYVGVQGIGTSRHELHFLLRHGVTHMDTQIDPDNLDLIARQREEAAAEGVDLEMMHIPMPESITFANDSQRDRDLDTLCSWIEAAGKADLRGLNYNFTVVGYQRTPNRYGRGGSIYSSFEFDKYDNDEPHPGGKVDRDEIFARISYFLERVIPVAEEYKVKMACHPHDPGMPPSGYRGVDRVLGTVEGAKKFADLVDSPYHGFNFCQGTFSEMLEDPGKEIFDVIRYFGQKKKIFMVHFRNIRGKRLDFEETYIDEGDVDMWEAMKVYHEVGYDGVFCPDHVARSEQDSGWGHRQRAFTAGYIKALIKAVENP